MEDDEVFEQAESGASDAHPIPCNDVRKGKYIVMKGRPARVVDTSVSKTGKHGHAKMHIVGIDMFNGRKYEELVPTSHNVFEPDVIRKEYTILAINEDGFLSLMPDDPAEQQKVGTREDLKLPEDEEITSRVRANFEAATAANKQCAVTVYQAMGVEQILETKVID